MRCVALKRRAPHFSFQRQRDTLALQWLCSSVSWWTMSLDSKLLEILACPRDKGPLEYLEDEQVLVNPRLKIAYRIDDGIPVMLSEEAIAWDK